MTAAWRSAFSGHRPARPSDRGDQAAPNSAAATASAANPPSPPRPIDRIYAHREPLFVCALQLLDEPRAAQQVVSETIDKALLGLKDPGAEVDPELERSLDRLLVSLTLVRLKAMPQAMAQPRKAAGDSSTTSPFATNDKASDQTGGQPDPIGQAGQNGPAAANAPSEPVVEGQFARTAQALASLPIEARVAVTLVVMQGRSLAETAFLLGTSEESCRFFLNHGRKLLRRALQRDLLSGDGEGRSDSLLEKLTSGTTTLHDLRRSKKATIRA